MTVNMGAPILKPSLVPVKLPGKNAISVPYNVNGKVMTINALSMGNPHCVVFVEHLDNADIKEQGIQLEYDSIFPNRANVEFAKIVEDNTLKIRTWDRGCGETLSSGSGACAAVVASVLNGYFKKNEDITVIQKGGEVVVRYTDEGVLLKSTAVKVFDGEISL